MIELADLKDQLQGLPDRAARRQKTERWATNTLEGIPEDIIPRVPEAARPALERLAGMCESIGPRILKTRRFGAIGDINWGAGNAHESDDYLRDLDLEGLASEFLIQGEVSGILAGIVRRDPDDENLLFIELLSGHVELIYKKGSNQQVIGLIQAWVEQRKTSSGFKAKWSVRIFDLQEHSLLGWEDLNSPEAALKAAPVENVHRSAEYPEGAPTPRYVLLQKHPRTQQPFGEMEQLLPLIQSDWSSQLRGDRAEENTAFPQLKIIGKAEDGTKERSSAYVVRLAQGGDAAFIEPGDLSQLHTHHDRKLERLREDANMPGGFLGSGGTPPSGESLREANQKFISSCRYYAVRLERLLNMLVDDYFAARGLMGVEAAISLQINREFTKSNEIEMMIQLYDAELVPLSAAVRAISVFVPTWTDEEVENYIKEASRPLTTRPPLPSQLTSQDERVLS